MDCWDIDQHRARDRIGPGTVVLDIGASTGEFALPASRTGARVVCVEVLADNCAILRALGLEVIEAAAGPHDGWCMLVESEGAARATGSHIEAGPGPTRMLSLASILGQTGPVDVAKVDIEGGEYALIDGTAQITLAQIAYLAVELHEWTTPDEPARPGVGVRAGAPMPTDAIGRLMARLSATHEVERVDGLVFATRD